MRHYIYAVYMGKLVFQKRKNGLFYDGKTGEKLSPQPDTSRPELWR